MFLEVYLSQIIVYCALLYTIFQWLRMTIFRHSTLKRSYFTILLSNSKWILWSIFDCLRVLFISIRVCCSVLFAKSWLCTCSLSSRCTVCQLSFYACVHRSPNWMCVCVFAACCRLKLTVSLQFYCLNASISVSDSETANYSIPFQVSVSVNVPVSVYVT